MSKKQPLVKSKFNTNEKFTFDNTPTRFDSITEQSIADVKEYCLETIEKKFNGKYDARTLYAMAGMVFDNFDLLYSHLEGDYGCRRANLKRAQEDGISKVNERLLNFEKTVADHDSALELFRKNVADFNGEEVDKALAYPKNRLDDYKKRLTNIKEKKYYA